MCTMAQNGKMHGEWLAIAPYYLVDVKVVEHLGATMETNFYSARDLTARFRITAQTLRNWERDKKIPVTGRTPGGHRRYTEEHVKASQAMLGTISDQAPAATA